MQEQASEYKKQMGIALLFVAFYLIITLVSTLSDIPWIVRNDCAMYLRSAELILQGKIPYVDFCDINPPLIMYIMTLPVLLGQITHLGSIVAFNLFIFLIIIAATFALKQLFDQQKDHIDSKYFSLIMVGYALTNFLAALWHEYGQRDHLFAILLLPFFFVRLCRWNDLKIERWQSLLWGALISIPICLRPFNLFILAAPEIYWLATKKRWRPFIAPEAIAAFCGALTYFIFLLTAVPGEGRTAWLKHIVPIVVRGYESYDQPLSVLLLLVVTYGVLPCWLIAFCSACFKKSATLTAPLLVQGLAAIILYLCECKPWANHLLPALVVCTSAFLIQAGIIFARSGFAQALALLLLLPYPLILANFQQFNLNAEKELILKESEKSDNVMVLSAILPNSYPTILQTERGDGGRYFFLFPISMILYARTKNPTAADRAIYDAEENRFFDQLEEDVRTRKPALILIDNDPKNLISRQSMVDYLQTRDFVTHLSPDYERIGLCQAASELVVYKRKRKD